MVVLLVSAGLLVSSSCPNLPIHLDGFGSPLKYLIVSASVSGLTYLSPPVPRFIFSGG